MKCSYPNIKSNRLTLKLYSFLQENNKMTIVEEIVSSVSDNTKIKKIVLLFANKFSLIKYMRKIDYETMK